MVNDIGGYGREWLLWYWWQLWEHDDRLKVVFEVGGSVWHERTELGRESGKWVVHPEVSAFHQTHVPEVLLSWKQRGKRKGATATSTFTHPPSCLPPPTTFCLCCMAQMVKNLPAVQETWVQFLGWKIPWSRARLPVFLIGEFHGQRCLAGSSSWGLKESDITEQLSPPFTTFSSVQFSRSVMSDSLQPQGA